jgi:hypothetical protein
MSLKIENSRRVAKSRPVCMDLKNRIRLVLSCRWAFNELVPGMQASITEISESSLKHLWLPMTNIYTKLKAMLNLSTCILYIQ